MEQNKNSESSDSPPPPEPAPAGSGFFYKDGGEIAPTHPDHGPMHLLPRQEDGSFATYYYCSKAELYDMEIPAPPPRRKRRDGFSAERQEQFLEAIRGGASGREAARLVGISPTTAYNLYNSPDGAAFRAAWDSAARVTDIVLEDTAFDRAVNGQEEIVFHKGQRVGKRWKYDNNLLMKLLRARQPLKYAPLSEIEGWLRTRGIAAPPDVDGALDRLQAAEEEWGRRLPGEEAPARLEDRSGGAPQSVRPELVEGPSFTSEAKVEVGPSTGSGRTEQAATDHGSTLSPSPGEIPPVQSTSSTSPGHVQPGKAAVASTSSTSCETGQPETTSAASTSSTSPGNGQAQEDSAAPASLAPAAQEVPVEPTPPPAEAPDPGLIPFRPPPRPRIFLAP